jgi:hypothetical protein
VQIQDTFNISIRNEIYVSVLSCDTITQVKEKILDAYHRESSYSKRKHIDNYDLVYVLDDQIIVIQKSSSRVVLNDEDHTSKCNKDHKRLNTLAHYGITNGCLLLMYECKPSTGYVQFNCSNESNYYSVIDNKKAEMVTLLSK